MPLFFQQHINEHSRLAVWHITEDETFFRQFVSAQKEVTHPHKRLQHLAGRYLLKLMDPGFPVEKIILQGRKPVLANGSPYFSISHCGNFAAAIISKKLPVGIDVELSTEKLSLLEKKFLQEKEQRTVRECDISLSLNKKLTACWSAKEVMFKWYGKGSVDFRKDMEIGAIKSGSPAAHIEARFHKEVNRPVDIRFRFFDDLCLAWLVA